MKINIIGGGLAGSEAALQIAKRGIEVDLYEMRPKKLTEAHKTDLFAEVVCSNSFGSMELKNPRGLLKEEASSLGSILLQVALRNKVPAGKALAIDRERFSKEVTSLIFSSRYINVIRKEVDKIPDGITVIATGPLTSASFLKALGKALETENLYFYDAISPIITAESLDMSRLFFGGRYGKGSDYLNAPLTKEEYGIFYNALVNAEQHLPHNFERGHFFDACLPVEEIAKRGKDSLRFGPLRPVGFDKKYFAVVQLRKENIEGSLYELVGFQTSLRYGEQERVLRLIPGFRNAEFVRFGSIHKNAYIKSSALLKGTLQLKKNPLVLIAGQLSGVEGYVESIATGLLSGINATRIALKKDPISMPRNTLLGSLIHFIIDNLLDTPQPMRANFGLIPEEFLKINKSVRREKFIEESKRQIESLKEVL